jgi:hypothetical protein
MEGGKEFCVGIPELLCEFPWSVLTEGLFSLVPGNMEGTVKVRV